MSVESFRGPGGATLYYRYDDFTDPWGDAPTAILCHGHPRNSNLWYAWVPPLSRHVKVARLDMRGLGLSKVPIETYENSVESLVLDAIALMDHLKQDKVIWVGEATGALLGMVLALLVPERLHALVTMTAPLKIKDNPLYARTQNLRPGESIVGQDSIDFMLSKGMRAWAEMSVRTRPRMEESPPGLVAWYIDQLSQNDARNAAEFYRPMLQVDVSSQIKDIVVPTLYLDGDRDTMLTPDQQKEIQQHPKIRYVTIEGPGIDIGYARPEAATAHVKTFLTDLGLISA